MLNDSEDLNEQTSLNKNSNNDNSSKKKKVT
jgi:hypothetical protein